jgi:hypothetical protein
VLGYLSNIIFGCIYEGGLNENNILIDKVKQIGLPKVSGPYSVEGLNEIKRLTYP